MPLRRFLDTLYLLAGWLSGLCLVVMFGVVMAQVVGREMGVLVPGADNVAAWLCAASAFLCLAHTFKSGELMQVGLLLEKLSPAQLRIAETVALVIAVAFSGFMSYAAVVFTHVSWTTNEMPQSGTLALPLWIPQSSFALGAILLTVAFLDDLLLSLRGQVPAYRKAMLARRAAGDFSEGV